MLENINYLFLYLDKEKINIDKNEFQFQIESHPDYPTLVSITDTLSFFNIENGVLPVEIAEIEFLPEYFVALLDVENNHAQFYFVEKKGNDFFCTKDKSKMILSKSDLELMWRDIILLVEKNKADSTIAHTNKTIFFWVLSSLCIALFFFTLIQFQTTVETYIFFILPILGVLFSIAALKYLFGFKSEILNNFCNVTSSTSCASIVESKKWTIFKIVNFSDLSIVFFSSQFLGLLTFQLMENTTVYFSIQKTILFGVMPLLLTSVYYQKFVEKKWCPICLFIIGIIILELVYILFLQQPSLNLNPYYLIVFGLVIVTNSLCWFTIKSMLTQQKELKEFQIKGNRFMRNYEIFKNNLLASNSIENYPIQSEESIILGNPAASLKIIIVTSPFCSFCAEAHFIIEEIVHKYHQRVSFDIRFNFDNTYNNQKSKKIYHLLLSIYFNQGQKVFMQALHSWFENKDENKLSIQGNSFINELKLNLILKRQFIWNQHNRINFTPAIIINGYFLPKQYDRRDLVHFINDLSEDEFFQSTL